VDYIGSSVQEIEARADAPLTAGVLTKLKDLDANRIASNDQVVIRKAVLALLTIVSDLEARIAELEAAAGTSNGASDKNDAHHGDVERITST
jgi:hypothetical protein